ncbi:MAG: hypothetical protein ACREOC_12175 [Gemmatimonadales bacterium]
MGESAARRIRGLILAVVFVGGIGLPEVDGLLYHTHRQARPTSHVDLPGGCGAHTERCAIAGAFPTPRLASLAPAGVRALDTACPHEISAPALPPRSADTNLLQLPRAPPAPLA